MLVVLGPNNSGKSATLNDLKLLLTDENNAQPISLSDLKLARESSLEEIKIEIASARDPNGNYNIPGYGFHESNLNRWWSPENRFAGPFLTQQLVSDLTTRARLSDCDPPGSLDFRAPHAITHPFQRMYRDPCLEEKTSGLIRRAFKQDLVIHHSAGTVIPAYIGSRPALTDGEERNSLSYSKRVEALQPLEKQGDGIRSFVSIVSRVLTEDRSIQLIDEPEAFLHPPQARLVAETMAAHDGGRQTFVATHSKDVLQGLLSEHAQRVSVVRLTRPGGNASASYLPSDRVAALWRDPILRFSNVLDGLFHDGVVVTEADADCRFYEAVANATVPNAQRPDIHYTYSGGKDRLPTVVAALVGLKVPVATIVDFDVLNNDQPLRRIFEAHGGDWAQIEADWGAVKAAVEAKEAFLGSDQFRREMTDLLKELPAGSAVPKDVLSKVRGLAKRASPWDNIKSSGLSAIAPGEPTVTTQRLLETLRRHGVFVAPMGEMEGFCRSISGHGPRWVEEALKRDLANDAELVGARTFISDAVTYLRGHAA